MDRKSRRQKVLYLCLVAVLAVMGTGQLATGQVTTDWPLMNASPQQTRFADVTAGEVPQGILWRYPASFLEFPVLSDGFVFLNSEILDAKAGQCLYKFRDTATAQAIGAVLGGTYLFRSAWVSDGETTHVTTSAYDIADMPEDPSSPWYPKWSRPDDRFKGWLADPQLNFMGGYLYLSPMDSIGVVKINGATGDEVWRLDVPSRGPVAIGDCSVGRLVIAAGSDRITAIGDTSGTPLWSKQYDAGQPTLLPDPINAVVVPIQMKEAEKKGRRDVYSWVLCLEVTDGTQRWVRKTAYRCWPWNGPAAVRYHEKNGQASATVYATVGSGTVSDADWPLYAFAVEDGSDAWTPNPSPLSVGTISVPTATKDMIFTELWDGTVESVDAVTGAPRGSGYLELTPSSFYHPIAVDDGSGFLLYAYSDRLGYLALAPHGTHNMSLMTLSVPGEVDISDSPITVGVTVENVGSCQENNVTARLWIDAVEVDSWLASYGKYGSQDSSMTFQYEWHPTGTSHELTATVEAIPGEIGIYDNSASRTVTVLNEDVVTITSAYWVQNKKRLYIKATSSRQPEAVLWVQYEGVGSKYEMSFDSAGNCYTYSAHVPDPPCFVVVASEFGGSDSRDVSIRPR